MTKSQMHLRKCVLRALTQFVGTHENSIPFLYRDLAAAHDVHAYEMHANKVHVHNVHTMHAREVHAHEVHAHEIYAREMHTL